MARPLTAAELARGAAKEAKAQAHWRDVQKKRQGATPYATANDLSVGYQGQINYYYCGPATTAMIAAFIGDGWSGTATQQQNAAANLLATTASGGTAWYGSDNVPNYPYGSWYPVADTLNYQIYERTGGGGTTRSRSPAPRRRRTTRTTRRTSPSTSTTTTQWR